MPRSPAGTATGSAGGPPPSEADVRAAWALLDRLPRLGWIDAPSPVQRLDGPGWVGVKRDDVLPVLAGGTKPRKLDGILAAAPWVDARRLVSVGAVGSGHLVAMAAAAERLGRAFVAHTFWEPLTPHVLENLAYIATRAEIHPHHNRVTLALTAPGVLLGSSVGDAVVVPPGGTCPEGMVGLARAGVELAEQVLAGDLPRPDRIYVALGSGGTAAGLAAGLTLAGMPVPIVAVATVERPLISKGRLRAILGGFVNWLAERGIPLPGMPEVHVDHSQIGPGYGMASPASWAAVAALEAMGVPAEPVYTGKAWAAVMADRAAGRAPEHVLYWFTSRHTLPAPREDWRGTLPRGLRTRLEREEPRMGRSASGVSRRGLLVGGALLVAAGGAVRVLNYRGDPAFEGALLWDWEAEVLRAAAVALVPPAPLTAVQLDQLPHTVDAFLASLPDPARLEIHALFVLIEHAAGLTRFTRLPAADRLRFIEELDALGPGHLAAKGLRDLVMLGYYTDPGAWAAIGYEGPWVSADRAPIPAYEALRAAPDARPRSAG